MSSPRRLQSSPDRDSPGGIGTQETYGSGKVLAAVIKVTGSTTCQKDLTAKRNKTAKTGFPKYEVAHRKRAGGEREGCAIVGLSKLFSRQAVRGMAANKVEEDIVRKHRHGTGKTDMEGFYYTRVFRRDEIVEFLRLTKLEGASGEMLRSKAVS